MRKELLDKLKQITPEEEQYLNGTGSVRTEFYAETVGSQFIIDSSKLLAKGRLIELRPHTRFVHFPKHKHNYVELVYMCSGSTTHILNDKQNFNNLPKELEGIQLHLTSSDYLDFKPLLLTEWNES